jgi:hypothetical protein
MDSGNPWKLIKAGFWLSIGFIVPSITLYCLATFLIYRGMASWSYEEVLTSDVKSEQIIINEYKDVYTGNQVTITGSLTNTADAPANSIELEAEMYDAKGEFVYECSEYVSETVEAGETENFQIKCGGCSDKLIPEYDSVKVSVVGVSNF